VSNSSRMPTLRVSTGWVGVTATGEPTIVVTYKGYAPVLPVRVDSTGLDYILYISSKSLTEALEPLRRKNKNVFTGLRFGIRKQSEDRFAPYELTITDYHES